MQLTTFYVHFLMVLLEHKHLMHYQYGAFQNYMLSLEKKKELLREQLILKHIKLSFFLFLFFYAWFFGIHTCDYDVLIVFIQKSLVSIHKNISCAIIISYGFLRCLLARSHDSNNCE